MMTDGPDSANNLEPGAAFLRAVTPKARGGY
jgi:hypothetical protein